MPRAGPSPTAETCGADASTIRDVRMLASRQAALMGVWPSLSQGLGLWPVSAPPVTVVQMPGDR